MKELLKIDYEGMHNVGMHINVEGEEELYALCIALNSLFKENPGILIAFTDIMMQIKDAGGTDKFYKETEFPDFNKLLKDLK